MAKRFQTIKLIEKTPRGRPTLEPADIAHYEEVSRMDRSAWTLDRTVTELCVHAALAEMLDEKVTPACRAGIEQEIADVLALIAVRKANSVADLEQKLATAEIIDESERDGNLWWALQASARCDALRLFPGSTRAEIDDWIAARRKAWTAN